MDFNTLTIAQLTSLGIYTLTLSGLALGQRHIVGVRWFALYQWFTLARTALVYISGPFPGSVEARFGALIYMLSIGFLYLGVRWFVLRKSLQPFSRIYLLVVGLMVFNTLFPFSAIQDYGQGMILIVVIMGFAIRLLLTTPAKPLALAARVTAGVMTLHLILLAYRMGSYVIHALMKSHPIYLTQPEWLYSTLISMVTSACMAGCFIWLYVAEIAGRLLHQARTDQLTGVLNRRAFDEEAQREISRSNRHGLPLSLIVLDLDLFKSINDTAGHAAGDRALMSLANLLAQRLRQTDLVARTGGEEFVLLLPETSLAQASLLAEQLRRAIEDLVIIFDRRTLRITASLGVAQLGADPDDSWEALLRRADLAMYAAKQGGRNRVVAQSPVDRPIAPSLGATRSLDTPRAQGSDGIDISPALGEA